MKDSSGVSSGRSNVVKINRVSGRYHCSLCGSAGSWFDFKANLEGQVLQISPARSIIRPAGDRAGDAGAPPAPDLRLERYAGSLPMSKDALAWLVDKRKITLETLLAYKVLCCQHHFSCPAAFLSIYLYVNVIVRSVHCATLALERRQAVPPPLSCCWARAVPRTRTHAHSLAKARNALLTQTHLQARTQIRAHECGP